MYVRVLWHYFDEIYSLHPQGLEVVQVSQQRTASLLHEDGTALMAFIIRVH